MRPHRVPSIFHSTALDVIFWCTFSKNCSPIVSATQHHHRSGSFRMLQSVWHQQDPEARPRLSATASLQKGLCILLSAQVKVCISEWVLTWMSKHNRRYLGELEMGTTHLGYANKYYNLSFRCLTFALLAPPIDACSSFEFVVWSLLSVWRLAKVLVMCWDNLHRQFHETLVPTYLLNSDNGCHYGRRNSRCRRRKEAFC
jgi:hypothetical protein